MAAPIAQDDDITASRTSVRVFDVFADNGNGVDSDPDGDRISVSRVENKISWVNRSFTLESGARARTERDGTLIFNPNDAYDDLDPGERVTESIAYTIRDPGGSVDHAEVEITVEGPEPDGDIQGLYFRATGPTGGAATIWVHQPDGSTVEVTDAATGTPFIELSGPISLGDAAFASARLQGTSGYPLWRLTDSATAERVDDNGLTSAESLRQAGDYLYFVGDSDATGEEIWRVDEAGNAELMADLTPGSEGSDPSALTASNGVLYFTADTAGGAELFRLGADGAIENIQDALPASARNVTIVETERANDSGPLHLQFSTSGTGGKEHYFSLDGDGTVTRLSEVPPSINGNFVLGDTLYAQFEQPSTGETRLYQINENAPAERIFGPNIQSSVLVTEDAAYFANGDATWGEDVAPRPYRLTVDNGYQSIGSGLDGAGDFREVDGEVFFSADAPGTDESAIYKVVETASVNPTAERWSPPDLSEAYNGPIFYDGMSYFVGQDDANGREVWRADPDGSGAERVTDIVAGPGSSYPSGLRSIGTDMDAAAGDDPLLA